MAYWHAAMARDGIEMRWGGYEEPDDIMANALKMIKARKARH